MISVVVPVHNRESILHETLNSVCAQTWPTWECIVVDDHSSDGSVAVAQAYANRDSRFRVMRLPGETRGPSLGRNYGLAQAQGAYISFLDSDDLFAPEKLSKQWHVFAQRPDLDMVNCRMATFAESMDDVTYSSYSPPSYLLEFLLRRIEAAAVWQSGCPLWKTETLRRIGGWDENFFWSEDLELFLRAVASGVAIESLSEPLYFLRRSQQDRISLEARINKENQLRQVYKKAWALLQEAGLDNELRRRLCADNFYRRARSMSREGQVVQAIADWFGDSRGVGQTVPRTLVGMLLLLTQHVTVLHPLARRLRQRYFKHQQALPSLLS